MTTTRRTGVFAILLAIALSLSACTKAEDASTESGQGGKESGGSDAPKVVEAGPGFDEKTIKVGAIAPLTGLVFQVSGPVAEGNKAYFDALNAAGGVAGKYKVEVVQGDIDYFEPASTVPAYNKLKGDVAMFVQVFGTQQLNALLPLLKADDILAGATTLDAEWVRDAHVLPMGGPYQIQMINAASYYMVEGAGERQGEGAGKVACSMVHDTAYGEAGQAGIEYAAGSLGYELASTVRHKPQSESFAGQITQLKDAGCEVIFLVTLPTDVDKIMTEASTQGLTAQWIAQAPSWNSLFAGGANKDYYKANFLLATEGAAWADPASEGMTTMLADMAMYTPEAKPSNYFTFGYAQAKAVHAVLEEAVELGDLSHAGIVEAMNSVGTVEFGGIIGDYTYGPPADREPPRATSLFTIDPDMPIALSLIIENYESELAKGYDFG